jgi:hypothetical protein
LAATLFIAVAHHQFVGDVDIGGQVSQVLDVP